MTKTVIVRLLNGDGYNVKCAFISGTTLTVGSHTSINLDLFHSFDVIPGVYTIEILDPASGSIFGTQIEPDGVGAWRIHNSVEQY